MRLTIVGGGRAAWAFGSSWKRAGGLVDRVILREGSTSRVPELLSTCRVTHIPDQFDSDFVLAAVPDDDLASVCETLNAKAPSGAWLFHPSGSHDSTLFGRRARAFSLHPLRALPPVGEGPGLENALLVHEGDEASAVIALEIADRIDARFATVRRDQKPAYHAAAVIAANLVAAQLDVAASLMTNAGINSIDPRDELAELARSALTNWTAQTGAERFTGPIARGDAKVVQRHLKHLEDKEEAFRVYRESSLALCRRLLELRPDDPSLLEIKALLSASRLS